MSGGNGGKIVIGGEIVVDGGDGSEIVVVMEWGEGNNDGIRAKVLGIEE